MYVLCTLIGHYYSFRLVTNTIMSECAARFIYAMQTISFWHGQAYEMIIQFGHQSHSVPTNWWLKRCGKNKAQFYGKLPAPDIGEPAPSYIILSLHRINFYIACMHALLGMFGCRCVCVCVCLNELRLRSYTTCLDMLVQGELAWFTSDIGQHLQLELYQNISRSFCQELFFFSERSFLLSHINGQYRCDLLNFRCTHFQRQHIMYVVLVECWFA